jgi:cytoskeletal protein RodZ
LDEAARMTKIRPSRLAEIEADDFSQFPSLAYAKGFLLIYGKFLEVDVGPYMEAFETSEHVTVDGYSYLQDNPAPAAARSPVVRRRPSRPVSASSPSSRERPSFLPLIIGAAVILLGFWIGKLVVNLRRLSPPPTVESKAMVQPMPPAGAIPSPRASIAPSPKETHEEVVNKAVSSAPTQAVPVAPPSVTLSLAPAPAATPAVAAASPPPAPSAAASEPEVRRAEPVRAEDLAKAKSENTPEASGANRVAIRPLKKTYIKVIVDNEAVTPAFERWVSPSDGTVEFRGEHVAIRVLDRDAIQIKKNGKLIADDDSDVTIE